MAQRVEVRITSDLSGDEGAATHLFGIDGNTYEIDLTEKEAAKLRTFLTTYVEKGRKVRQGGRATARRSGSNGTGPNPRDVRAWAKAQKIAVPERGRIPGAVIEQFEKAQG